MGKCNKNTDIEDGSRPVQALSNKKILKNIRIYKRDGEIIEEEERDPIERYLPQFLANFAINLIMADTGLALSYPTLVNGYVYKSTNSSERDTFLHLDIFTNITFTSLQSSVYSSLQYLLVPIGSIMGGCIIDRFGRKKIIFLASCPMFISWIMIFFSQNVTMLFFSNIFAGLGIGISESAIATYQGEITEPRIRSTVINFAIVWLSVAFLVPYIVHLGIPSWRWIALFLSVVPVVAGIVALIVPESPVWLLSKGHITLAERSLSKLRGGATKAEIAEQIQEIISYHNSSAVNNNKHPALASPKDSLLNRDGLKELWAYLKSDCMRRPFILSCIMFTLVYSTGVSTIRPYINAILKIIKYHGNWTTIGFTLTLVGLLGNIFAVLVVGYSGKRILTLSGLAINGLSALIFAIAIFKHLPMIVKLISLHVMLFVTGYGIVPIPWILQSEIYPFRARGFIAGLAAAVSYILGFISTLIFLPLTSLITIQGMFIIFFIISIAGAIYMYFKLPETEGRTLEQIETFFSEKNKANV